MNIQLSRFQDMPSHSVSKVGALQYASWINHRKEKIKKKNNFNVLYGKSYKRFPFDFTC